MKENREIAAPQDASVPSGATRKAGDRPLSPAVTATPDKEAQPTARTTRERLLSIKASYGVDVGLCKAEWDELCDLAVQGLRHSASSVTLDKEVAARALKAFENYFLDNYPPDCILAVPAWHAPKIFRAALHAIEVSRRYVVFPPKT